MYQIQNISQFNTFCLVQRNMLQSRDVPQETPNGCILVYSLRFVMHNVVCISA